VQVQEARPCAAASAQLAALLARSADLLQPALAHPLQAVRASAAQLAALCLAATLSPRPLLVASEPPAPGCTADAFLGVVRGVVQRGADALEAADSPSPPTDLATPGNATEASIGSAAALAQALIATSVLQPLVLDEIVATVLPWVIEAQRLQCPDLQGLMLHLHSSPRCRPARRGRRGRRAHRRLHCFRLRGSGAAPSLARAQAPAHSAQAHADADEHTRTPGLQTGVDLSCRVLLAALRRPRTPPFPDTAAPAASSSASSPCRNYFCLSNEQLLSIVTTCRQRLEDERPEIGVLAGSTLSGLIRVLPDAQLETLLTNVLRDAARVFPQRRRNGGGGAATATVSERQACALSLRSLLQSSPYQIKAWCVLSQLPPPFPPLVAALASLRLQSMQSLGSQLAEVSTPRHVSSTCCCSLWHAAWPRYAFRRVLPDLGCRAVCVSKPFRARAGRVCNVHAVPVHQRSHT
jgi:hypothetical protein